MSKRIKESTSDRLFVIFMYSFTFVILCMVFYPLLFVISSSLSSPESVAGGEVLLFPKNLSLEAYKLVFENNDIIIGFRNSLFYTIVGTAINMLLTILLAYPLSRKDLPGHSLITFFVAFTMFFSGGLIPTYLVVEKLRMVDTIWAMVIPSALSTFNMIIMRTYFQTSIPGDLQESASLDGCSNFKFLIYIVLPLSTPILAVLVLYYGVAHWNAYFNALIYLRSNKLVNLQLVLRNILMANEISTGGNDSSGFGERAMIGVTVKYAVIVVSSIPVLILYPFIQKYFIKGIMVGAIKG
jgi:putative aldouronate transport system permease protein